MLYGKKKRAQNKNPEFPALWLLSYPWAGVYFPKDKNIPILIKQHPGTPWSQNPDWALQTQLSSRKGQPLAKYIKNIGLNAHWWQI